MDGIAAMAAACLKAKHLGIFPEANPEATPTTLEGFFRGKKGGEYKPQYENFRIENTLVPEREILSRVTKFFVSQGFELKDDGWRSEFNATKGETKIWVLVTPSPIMSFVTVHVL